MKVLVPAPVLAGHLGATDEVRVDGGPRSGLGRWQRLPRLPRLPRLAGLADGRPRSGALGRSPLGARLAGRLAGWPANWAAAAEVGAALSLRKGVRDRMDAINECTECA